MYEIVRQKDTFSAKAKAENIINYPDRYSKDEIEEVLYLLEADKRVSNKTRTDLGTKLRILYRKK